MSGPHRKPTPEEKEAQASFLDALARVLGIPWHGRGAKLGRACGVSRARIHDAYSGRVYVSPATLAKWRAVALDRSVP